MLRKMLFAAAGVMFFATPALAGPWVNYDGYQPIDSYAVAIPYGYPFMPYTDAVIPVPVVTYAPVHVRVYAVPQQPPYYNVPPYVVYAPY